MIFLCCQSLGGTVSCGEIFGQKESSIYQKIMSNKGVHQELNHQAYVARRNHPLLDAAEFGQWWLVAELLEAPKAEWRLQIRQGSHDSLGRVRSARHTLLTLAIESLKEYESNPSLIRTIEILLKKERFDPNFSPYFQEHLFYGRTLLQMAAEKLPFELFRLVANHPKADLWQRSSDGNTLLSFALFGDFKTFSRLVNKGLNPMIRDQRGLNALHHAALFGREEHMFALVRTMDVDSPSRDGYTALTLAIQTAQYSKVKYLVEFELADINYLRRDGWRPLHFATRGLLLEFAKQHDPLVRRYMLKTIRALLEKPYDKIVHHPQARIFFDYAQIFQLLVRNGASPNISSEKVPSVLEQLSALVYQSSGFTP